MFVVKIRWLALALVMVAHMLIGAVWYAVLEQPWLAAIGKSADEVPAGSVALYALPLAAALLNAWIVAWVLDRTERHGGVAGITVGLAVGAATIIPFALLHNAFAGFSSSLTLIDAGVAIVCLAVTGLILGTLGAPRQVAEPSMPGPLSQRAS